MSRSSFPSLRQIHILLDMLDEKKFLATGHARTAHAREKTRAAWEAVASRLNSEEDGAIKTGPQWAKYWKDKKSATKKKASLLRMARLRTGGGSETIAISTEEERIINIMGGEAFAVGDEELEVDPLQADTSNNAMLMVVVPNGSVPKQEGAGSENILEGYMQSVKVEPGTECMNAIPVEYQPHTEQLMEPESPPAMQRSTHNINIPPRRRITRPRLLQRTQPSHRRSQMASLTERFLAIEERRLDTLSEVCRSMTRQSDAVVDLTRSMSRQSDGLVDLIRSMSRQTDAVVDLNRSISRQTEAVVELCKLTKEAMANQK